MLGLAIQSWILMNGSIDYAALPIIAEMLGVTDIEQHIRQLVLIRDHQRDS